MEPITTPYQYLLKQCFWNNGYISNSRKRSQFICPRANCQWVITVHLHDHHRWFKHRRWRHLCQRCLYRDKFICFGLRRHRHIFKLLWIQPQQFNLRALHLNQRWFWKSDHRCIWSIWFSCFQHKFDLCQQRRRLQLDVCKWTDINQQQLCVSDGKCSELDHQPVGICDIHRR